MREIALRESELNVAVTCLREMRTVDKEMLIGQPRDGSRSVQPAGTSLEEALPAPEPIKQTPEMIRAFERSRDVGRHDSEEAGDDET